MEAIANKMHENFVKEALATQRAGERSSFNEAFAAQRTFAAQRQGERESFRPTINPEPELEPEEPEPSEPPEPPEPPDVDVSDATEGGPGPDF